MDEPIPLLMNTRAGALHGPMGAGQISRMAREQGFAVRIIQTYNCDAMNRELEQLVADKTPRIGVAGGDGTVEAVAQKLAYTETALGILSQGTFNNVATSLQIPHNLPAALRVLHRGQVRTVDMGKIGDRYFTESAGIGLFADGLALYGQGTNKNFFRGLLASVQLLLSLRPQIIRLIIDDGEPITERMVSCEIANTYRIAQAMPIAPNADMSDGILNVVVIGNISRREVIPYLKAIRAQMHLDLPEVRTYSVKQSIRIETKNQRRRNFHADDQVGGITPVTIFVAPGALKVLVDADGSASFQCAPSHEVSRAD